MDEILSRPTVLTSDEITKVVGAQYMKRCFPLLAVLWVIVAAHWVKQNDNISVLVTAMAIVATAAPYLQAVVGVARLKRRLSVPHQYEISNRTLRRVFEDGVESKYPWHLFERAIFHGDYVLLFLNWTAYVIVPMKCLSDEGQAKLRHALHEHNL